MKSTCFVITLILVTLLTACTNHDYSKQLVLADSIMQSHSDSALHILQSIHPQQFTTQADHAYYALLLTQAKDKNYIMQTDDSLIRTSVYYYDSIGDKKMQARAHYYWGNIYRNANQCAPAIKEYLTALPLVKKTKDITLMSYIYNNIGYIYLTQDLNEKADSIYQLTEKLAIQLKDSNLWAECLFHQGKIDIRKGFTYFSQAEQKILKALQVTNNLKQNRIKASIAASLSSLYSRMRQTKKALKYAKQNIALQDDTMQCYKAFLLLGDAYFKIGKYDSATIYLYKSLPSKSYGTKVGVYMRLADIAKKQGNVTLSLEMERICSAYKDSLHQFQQSNDILSTEKEVQITQQQVRYESFLNKYRHYLIITLGVILLVFYVFHKRYQQKTHQLQQERLLLEYKQQSLHQQYMQEEELLVLKEKEIADLQAEITSQQINEEKKQALQVELSIMIKRREALAKEAFEHSKVYTKMERIILDFKTKDKSDEKLNEEDWQQLLFEIDMRWNGRISRLSAQYQLSKEETHLLYLFLTDFPFTNLEYFTRFSRRTLYRKKDEILVRIGTTSGSTIEDILQNY